MLGTLKAFTSSPSLLLCCLECTIRGVEKKKKQKSVGSFWVFALLWPRAHTCLPQPSFPPSLMPRNQTHSYLLPCNHLLLENTPRQRETLWWEKPLLNNFKFVGICIHTCLRELLLSHVLSPQWKIYLMWCFFFLSKALCFLWKVLFQHSPYLLYFIFFIRSSCGEKLLSSLIHHREGFEPLSRRSVGWKRMGFLLMFNR